MTFEEALKYEPMRVEAMRELEKHGITWRDFVAETGNKRPTAQDVLSYVELRA